MESYLAGQPVSVTVPLVDSSGAAVSALSLEYRLIDQNETELAPKAPITTFTDGDTSATVLISAPLNALGVGESRGLRVVELYAVTEAGSLKIDYSYFIESEEVLVEAVNSFQNYSNAVFISYEIPNIEGWSSASKRDRVAALISAWRSIGQLCFRYFHDDGLTTIVSGATYSDITSLTPDQWSAVPAAFKEAIRRAQILEADYMLGGDELGDVRRAGLMSKTVGESKQFFRTTKAVESLVCKRAMKELAKYIVTSTRISRV